MTVPSPPIQSLSQLRSTAVPGAPVSWLLAALAPAIAMLALALAPQASASEPSTSAPAVQPAPAETPSGAGTATPTPAPTTPTSEPTESPTETTPEASTPGPQVETQRPQSATPSGSTAAGKGGKHGKGAAGTGGQPPTTEGTSGAGGRAKHHAPPPSTLTPALPLALGGPIAGIPGFFIESFRIPPFLLPIYQAAGTAYGIPWQVLAAINEVETDYGRDLSVSSAGAEGWMQFLPSSWTPYGVDANGDGFKDPYNPADAIFAAARYLRAAGGDTNVRAAVYAYNHSQAYVSSVMLRAQLLGGMPPSLLGAVTGLTQARFPVHAPSHFSDGFSTVPAHGSSPAKTLASTTIYSQVGAPVIAVQDGEIVQVGDSPSLGRFVSLRDAYGNTYIYSQLGSVARLYPVLEPHDHTTVSARIAHPGGAVEPAPSGPATAGAQSRSPLSAGATVSGLALGAAASLEPSPTPPVLPPAPAPPTPVAPRQSAPATARVFRSGPNDVYLRPLHVGAQVIAGTVLGHLGTQTGGEGEAVVGGQGPGSATGAGTGEPHVLFQIKPAGIAAPLIDPKPVLDGWVALENTSIFRAKGENPFLATSPTVGQVLLESKRQLERQVARDVSVHMRDCERQNVQTGRVDRRVLATIEVLSVSGLKPTVSGLRCAGAAGAVAGNASASADGDAVKITAVNGTPIAGHQGPGSVADSAIRKLLTLQGANRPRKIVSQVSYPGAPITIAKPSARNYIYVAFSPLSIGGQLAGGAHAAGVFDPALTPNQWIKLIARLGEIPDPTVASGPSAAAIPDKPGVPVPGQAQIGGEEAGDHH
jgi:Transglycosylase SLT domain